MKYLALILAAFCFSCDGDDANPAEAKCKALVEALCTRVIDCRYSDLPDRPQLIGSCRAYSLANTFRCDQVKEVGPSYDQCLAELPASSCANWTTSSQHVPVSCVGVIKI